MERDDRKAARRSRRRRILLVVLAVAVAAWIGLRCYVPRGLRQVAEPREGSPLNMVAIVYSRHYQIDLGGLEKLHPFDIHKYRLCVAGCDPLAGDPLASLAMTEGGIVRRDAKVIDACVERKVPVVMTLGGGYSADAWRSQYASIRRIIETYGLQGSPNPGQ